MASTKRLIVTTTGKDSIKAVRKRLAESGFKIDEVYDEIGSIIGSTDDDDTDKLRSIPGVTDVSPEEEIDIGPPNSPETW